MHWKIQGFYNSMDGWVDMSVICFTSSFSFLFLLSSLSIPPFALPLPLFLFHCRMGIGVNGARLDALSAHDWVFAMFSSWILWFWCIFYHFSSLEDYSWGINWFISILGAYCLIYLSASVNLDCPLSFFTLFFLYYDKSCSPCHILSLLLIFQYFYYARSSRLIIYLFSL